MKWKFGNMVPKSLKNIQGFFETLRLRKHKRLSNQGTEKQETNKPTTKKPRNRKPRNRETKKPRNQKPRNQEAKKLFYFQGRENPAPLNIPTPTPYAI